MRLDFRCTVIANNTMRQKKYFFRVSWDFLSVCNDIAYGDSEYAIRIFPSRTDFFKMTFEYFNEILLVYIL